ncbi:DUF5906 domain-containing protein [Sansalvadorimonas verongulae]|uniref:DUF5906 domain-containing protein n=1 Tax=Sansalvadorimonas verongulae TaxID=2172824 RepID=UPI0012BC49D8|nr:DUF5906 domain-containing protein [Sansalvadorimonas verongulae]MTI12256.1 hypothetical protein [Sansalvadorimonas verongulae]
MSLSRQQHEAVKLAANGQWPFILQSLGGLTDQQVDTSTKSSGAPCPLCGGENRYSFKGEDRGDWACRKCGNGGDGFELLNRVHGWDFSQSSLEVAKLLGIAGGSTAVDLEALRKDQAARDRAKEEENAKKLSRAIRKERSIWDSAYEIEDHSWPDFKRLSEAARKVCRQSGHKLLIPAFSHTMERVTHQWIGEKGAGKYEKNFHYGIPSKGLFVEFGASDSSHIIISQSFADTDAAFQLAGGSYKAISAFCDSQLPAVTKYAAEYFPESQLIICADSDEPGIEWAEKTASEVPGVWLSYPPSGKDWSEYMLSGGTESPLDSYEVREKESHIQNNEMPAVTEAPSLPHKADSGSVANNNPEQTSTSVSEEYKEQVPELINGRNLSEVELKRLKAMNKKFCHTVVGGRHVIATTKYCPITGEATAFEPIDQFKNYFHHRASVADLNVGTAWIRWAGKNRRLGGITFQPNLEKCPEAVFNLWRGFAVSPAPDGDCKVYLDHLFRVICGSDEKAYKYLIGWLAHMVQKPDEKPSVAVFMRSVMGAGKDTMVKAISGMLGIHATTQNGDEQITGRFQGALQEKLFVFINEARVTDSRAIDRLKSLITESEVSLELKGKDPVRIPNYARFIFASNHDHVIKADPKERRYLMLEPKPLYSVGSREHFDYFSELHKWIDEGGAGKLLAFLQGVDLTGFNPHSAPVTALLNEQKLYSMKPVHQFIREWLANSSGVEWKERVLANDLTERYRAWVDSNLGEKITDTRAGRALGSAMKELGIKKIRSNGIKYPLPELESMKSRFSSLYKTPMEEMF